MSTTRRASGTDATAPASPKPFRHSSLIEDPRGKIPIDNNMSSDRTVSDAGFASMDELSVGDIHHKQGSSREYRKHSSDYSSLAMPTQKHTSGTDNLGMTEDESGAKGGESDMYLDYHGGPLQAQDGNRSSVEGPGLDNNLRVPRPKSVISMGTNDSGHPSTPSPRSSNYTEDENMGEPSVTTEHEEGLVTRVEVGHNSGIFSWGGDSRKGSEVSNFSFADVDSIRSGSVDSAIDVNTLKPRPRARSMRSSFYEPILEHVITEEREAEPSSSAEGGQELQVHSATPDQPQQRAPDTVRLDLVENTVDSPSRWFRPALRLIRFILRIVTICIPRAHARSVEASYENKAYVEVAEVVPLSSAAPKSPPSPPSPPAQFSGAASYKKDEVLASFDRICSKAKDKKIDVVGRVIQIDNFAAAMLDSRGGSLSINALDVHLFIPPGAIPDEESPQSVYIYVQGSLTSGGNHLTPYVHCGPPGFHFHTDVFLTLPHCAKDALDKKFTFKKSTSEGTESIQHPEDGIVIVDRHSLTLSMDHFCGFGAASDKIVEKFMLVCPFIKQSSDKVDIHVRVFQNLEVNLQEVKREENALGFVFGEKRELIVQKTDQPVVAKLSSKADSWKITYPETACCEQTIQSEYLWRKYSRQNVRAFPCKPFCARNRSSSDTSPFNAVLKVFQVQREGHGVDFMLEVPTAAKIQQKPCKTLDDLMWGQIESPSGCDTWPWLDQDIYERICKFLDKPNPLKIDWHHLAEHLFGADGVHGHSWVEDVEKRAEREKISSPTKYVLDAFFTASRNKRKENTLRELAAGLTSMLSVRKDLEAVVGDIESQLPQPGILSVREDLEAVVGDIESQLPQPGMLSVREDLEAVVGDIESPLPQPGLNNNKLTHDRKQDSQYFSISSASDLDRDGAAHIEVPIVDL